MKISLNKYLRISFACGLPSSSLASGVLLQTLSEWEQNLCVALRAVRGLGLAAALAEHTAAGTYELTESSR